MAKAPLPAWARTMLELLLASPKGQSLEAIATHLRGSDTELQPADIAPVLRRLARAGAIFSWGAGMDQLWFAHDDALSGLQFAAAAVSVPKPRQKKRASPASPAPAPVRPNQPTTTRRQAAPQKSAASGSGETIQQYLARGGYIERLPPPQAPPARIAYVSIDLDPSYDY